MTSSLENGSRYEDSDGASGYYGTTDCDGDTNLTSKSFSTAYQIDCRLNCISDAKIFGVFGRADCGWSMGQSAWKATFSCIDSKAALGFLIDQYWTGLEVVSYLIRLGCHKTCSLLSFLSI